MALFAVAAVALITGMNAPTPSDAPEGWSQVPALVVDVAPARTGGNWNPLRIPATQVTASYAVNGLFLEATYDKVGTFNVGDTYPLTVNPRDARESVDTGGRGVVLSVRAVGAALLVGAAVVIIVASRRSRVLRAHSPKTAVPD